MITPAYLLSKDFSFTDVCWCNIGSYDAHWSVVVDEEGVAYTYVGKGQDGRPTEDEIKNAQENS